MLTKYLELPLLPLFSLKFIILNFLSNTMELLAIPVKGFFLIEYNLQGLAGVESLVSEMVKSLS